MRKRVLAAAAILGGLFLFGSAGSASATMVLPETPWALGEPPIAANFVLGPTSPGKWGPSFVMGTPGSVTWSLMPDGTEANDHQKGFGLPPSDKSSLFSSILNPLGPAAVPAIESAFATWAAVTNLAFSQVDPDTGLPYNHPAATGALAGDIRFGAYYFDGPSNVLAHGYFPPVNGVTAAGDLHYDEDENWVISALLEGAPTPLAIDWETVVLHELGHALGLTHSGVAGAVMAPFYLGVHRVLDSDDIAGIQVIYGAPIPEPATLLLLGTGLVGLGIIRRRRLAA